MGEVYPSPEPYVLEVAANAVPITPYQPLRTFYSCHSEPPLSQHPSSAASLPPDHALFMLSMLPMLPLPQRGFGFVEYEEKEDAAAAIDNMHNAELFGRVLKVNYAQPMKIKGGDKGWSHQPVWADADKYMEEMEAEQELEQLDKELSKKGAAGGAEPQAAAA